MSRVQIETTPAQPAQTHSRSGASTGPLVRLIDPRLFLILLLALLGGTLAYQAPPSAHLQVGWLGDQLFLPTSEGLGADQNGKWYGDELADHARSGRSRWTRQAAEVTFPGLGADDDLVLDIRAKGWPDDTLNRWSRQPIVTVEANGTVIGSFNLQGEWDDYAVTIPGDVARAGSDLLLRFDASDVFTSTRSYNDPRPKGMRVEFIGVRSADPAWPQLPPLRPLAWMLLVGALAYLTFSTALHRPTAGFVLATLVVAAVAIGLSLARAWAVATLPVVALVLLVLLLLFEHQVLLRLARQLLRRYSQGDALNYGLVVAAALWMAGLVAILSQTVQFPVVRIFRDTFPDSILYGLLGMGVFLLIIVRGRAGLPRLSNAIVRFTGGRRAAPVLLGIFLVIWVGYLASVVAALPYVGHADYSDNAVVARNLVAGRGWTVDYVTQFYRLYDGVTRPQETWPLLQPVWMAAFLALFGATAWAAKIPNLIFITLLALTVYTAGARLWDRRVGLTAVVMILTSYLFFNLVIYTTSDLAFVLFAFGAVYLLYRWVSNDRPRSGDAHPIWHRHWPLIGSGLLTGLMLLQKPGSGALMAFGMGIWLLRQAIVASGFTNPKSKILPVLAWGLVALLILSPYLARNLTTFGRLFYTTESKDAWVLEYTDWEDIYKVYAPEFTSIGIPEPSWILRWGFDRTLRKLVNQVVAIRDYIVPPWKGLPSDLGDRLFGRSGKAVLFGMGAWLAALGALGALGSRRRLLSLLFAVFVPYALFLIVYWHANEERYWVVLAPWLALLGSYALWRGYDRVSAIGDGRWAPVALALALAALLQVVGPSWPRIAEKITNEPRIYAADIDAYIWLRDHTGSDAVVMTRAPWQLNWHSQRPALMVPNTDDPDVLMRMARHYNTRYLVLDVSQRPSPQVLRVINQLIDDPQRGFTSVYRTPVYWAIVDGNRTPLVTEIYRFPT